MVELLLGADGDLRLEAGDFVLDEGLGSAVLASLYTDGRATADAATRADGGSRRGWWPDTEGDRWGSLLWTLARAKRTTETLARARETARDALAWLLEEDIAESVDVVAEYVAGGALALRVTIHRGSSARWAHVWEGRGPLTHEAGGVRVLLALEGGGGVSWS